MKGILNCCKLQVIFKNERFSRFEDCVPYDLVLGVDYEYPFVRCNSSLLETERHLKVRPGEHIGMLTFTFKKKKSSKESSIRHQLSTAE